MSNPVLYTDSFNTPQGKGKKASLISKEIEKGFVFWGMFRQMISYKAEWYGRTVVTIDKFYPSSKLCSICGETNPMLTLSVREWQCPHCKAVHNRDTNAARNILNEGLRLLSV